MSFSTELIRCGAVFQQVQVVFPTIVTGNMEEHVNKAAEFLPERWLKSPGDSLYRIHPFASLPYGHGARMCLGRRFADLEIQILLAKVSSSTVL
jgi:cytochrome P450